MSIRLMGGNVSFFTQARAGRDGGAVCNLDVSRFFFRFYRFATVDIGIVSA